MSCQRDLLLHSAEKVRSANNFPGRGAMVPRHGAGWLPRCAEQVAPGAGHI